MKGFFIDTSSEEGIRESFKRLKEHRRRIEEELKE